MFSMMHCICETNSQGFILTLPTEAVDSFDTAYGSEKEKLENAAISIAML